MKRSPKVIHIMEIVVNMLTCVDVVVVATGVILDLVHQTAAGVVKVEWATISTSAELPRKHTSAFSERRRSLPHPLGPAVVIVTGVVCLQAMLQILKVRASPKQVLHSSFSTDEPCFRV